MTARLEGRRALITGASGTIGSAIAHRLAEEGAYVALSARRQDRLLEIAQTIKGLGGEADVLPCDLVDDQALERLTEHIQGAEVAFDLLVHAADEKDALPFVRTPPSHWEKRFRLGVFPAFALSQAFAVRLMRAKSAGCVVVVASVAGFLGVPGSSLYAAGKGALIAWTRSVALEWAKAGIRVNAVAPAYVEGDMLTRMRRLLTAGEQAGLEAQHPLGLGRPEDVAAAVAYLASDDARWVTGSVLVVDGGFSAH
jgi:NAD(P)-dependent dehydrogenase (short-subunit alcohol dehydrogenase family)